MFLNHSFKKCYHMWSQTFRSILFQQKFGSSLVNWWHVPFCVLPLIHCHLGYLSISIVDSAKDHCLFWEGCRNSLWSRCLSFLFALFLLPSFYHSQFTSTSDSIFVELIKHLIFCSLYCIYQTSISLAQFGAQICIYLPIHNQDFFCIRTYFWISGVAMLVFIPASGIKASKLPHSFAHDGLVTFTFNMAFASPSEVVFTVTFTILLNWYCFLILNVFSQLFSLCSSSLSNLSFFLSIFLFLPTTVMFAVLFFTAFGTINCIQIQGYYFYCILN